MFSTRYEAFRDRCATMRAMTLARCAVVLAMLLAIAPALPRDSRGPGPGPPALQPAPVRRGHRGGRRRRARRRRPPMPRRSCWPAPTSNAIASAPTRPTSAPPARRSARVRATGLGTPRSRRVPARARQVAVPRGRLRRGRRDSSSRRWRSRRRAGDRAREAVLDWYGACRSSGRPRPYVDLAARADARPAGRAHGARAGRRTRLARPRPTGWPPACAARRLDRRLARGHRRPGCGRRSPARARRRCAPTSTGWCCRASSPTACREAPDGERDRGRVAVARRVGAGQGEDGSNRTRESEDS